MYFTASLEAVPYFSLFVKRAAFSGLEYFAPVPELALPAHFDAASDRSVFERQCEQAVAEN